MTAISSTQQTSAMHRFAPVIADLLALVLYLGSAGWLINRFSRNSLTFSALADAAILLVCHVLFLIGVSRLRRIGSKPTIALVKNRLIVSVLCVIYAVTFVFSIADLTGYLDTLFTVDFGDMGNAYYFLVTPAVYLLIGLLYLLLMRTEVDSAENNPTGLVPILLTNVMLVASAAFLRVFLTTTFESNEPIINAVISYGVLTVLFVLPRLLYSARTRNWLGLLSLDILLLILVVIPVIQP